MLIYQIGIILIIIKRGISKELFKYDMARKCGRKVTVRSDGKVYFHQNGRHISKCRFELRNPVYSWTDRFDQIAFHFTEIRNYGSACIHIGQYTIKSLTEGIPGLEPSYCNGKLPPLNTVYTTNARRKLFITFESDYKGYASFEFVFNKFETKQYTKCNLYKYQCDNNRCIPDDVNCNGHNPCGDNSDCLIRQAKEEDENYNDRKVEIPQQLLIVGSVIVCLVAVMTFVVRYRRKQQHASKDVVYCKVNRAGTT